MAADSPHILTVRELTHYLKHLLEQDPVVGHVQVTGEVSNLKYHSSGHVYFSIKDAESQLTCVMFRSYAQQAPRMQEGDEVVLTGGLTIYPPRGNYQLLVRQVRKAGQGDLFQRFIQLKEKLKAEGLFDAAHKLAIPALPKKIALITSPTGAAVRDMIQTLQRRFDLLQIVVIPTVVQGVQGAASILNSLAQAEVLQPDVIILGRGGGSIEDLWNFNEEAVARAIFNCPIPIISGIGHETDTTIADFVADVRASTPTAAAERAVPDKQALINGINEFDRRLRQQLQHFIDFKRQVVDDYDNRLEQAAMRLIDRKRHELDLLEAKLNALDQRQLLEKGYTLTLKNSQIIRSADSLKEGDEIETVFADGRVGSVIKQKNEA